MPRSPLRLHPATPLRRSRLLLAAACLLFAPCTSALAAETLPPQAAPTALAVQVESWRMLPFSDLEAQCRVALRQMSADQIALVRTLVFEAPPSYANDVVRGLVLERWGEFDGPAAYAYAATLGSVHKPTYETHALLGWSRQDPRAAWTRLMIISNRAADDRYGEGALLFEIAETDLPLALECYQDLMSERSCLLCNASSLVICALRHHQLPLVAATIARLPSGPSRNGLRDAYWSVTGQYATADALTALAAVTDGADRQAAQVHLARGWACRDFTAAFDHVLQHYDPDALNDAILPMIQSWAHGAVAEDVSAIIKKLPENLSERSLLGMVPVLARVDPAAATSWARTFKNDSIRRECLHRAMWEWARTDGEPAQTYLRAETDPDLRGRLLRSFVLSRVSNNTLQLADLEDFTDDFNVSWTASVLEELTLKLADPSTNRSASFDLTAYKAWVRARKSFTDDQRTRILQALEPAVAK